MSRAFLLLVAKARNPRHGTECNSIFYSSIVRVNIQCTSLFISNQPTNQLPNNMEQSPSLQANTSSGSQKFPAFYGTRKFITVL